jgi:uncharacterized protein
MNESEIFFNAIKTGNKEHVEVQLKRNPKLVNIKDSRGFTPLIFATYFDNETLAKLLIEYNAIIDDKDASGNTALIGVSFKGNESIARLLIEKGADINAINCNGITPLIFSTMYNKENIVKLLLEKRVDVTIKDNAGKTAYDYALEKKFDKLQELFKN